MSGNAYLTIPLKSTSEVDLIGPLRKFIGTSFGESAPEDIDKSLADFNRLRSQAVAKFQDKHESALETIYKYYDQLLAVETKLPLTEDQIRVNFKWVDAFAKSGLLGMRNATLTLPFGSYERCCILFNIAAIQSRVAAVQNRETDDGKKAAAKLFQLSAGILGHLKEHVVAMVPREPTRDLHTDTLVALAGLMLAQAQESVYTKALSDRMKDAVVAKICMQGAGLYAEALRLLQLNSIKDLWPKEWLPVVAGRQALYHALAEYYQSAVAKGSKAYGEEISRLKHSKDLMQAAITRGGKEVDYTRELARVEQALQAAEKDNSYIYHDKIPDINSLAAVGKAVVAKPLPLQQTMSANFKDLFQNLLPIQVIGALSLFDNRKGEMVSAEVGRLREATELLNSILASLNLPAAIEDTDGSAVPESLLEKSSTVRSNGGLDGLQKLLTDLPQLLQRNKEILDEAANMLSEEAASDMQLREQFGEKWKRMPSEELMKGPRAEEAKYRQIIENAVAADVVVRTRFDKARRGMELLTGGPDAVRGALPSASPVGALQHSPAVQKLRQLMSDVQGVKALRATLEEQFTSVTFDMGPKFIAALAADGALNNEEEVSRDALNTTFEPLREQVTASLTAQTEIIAQIQTSNNEFSAQKASDQSATNRDAMLKELAEAYDAFMGLKANCAEGSKFYNDLTPILLKYQNKISDLCFARKTEKEELLRDLQTAMASQPTGQAPPTPAYQSGGSSAATAPKPAPARPPPPSATSSSAAAPTGTGGAPPKPAPRVRPQPPAAAAPLPSAPSAGPPPAAGPGAPTSTLPYPPMPAMSYQPPMMMMPQAYNPYAVGYSGYGGAPQAHAPAGAPGYPQQPYAYPVQGQPAPYPQQQGMPYPTGPAGAPPTMPQYPYPRQQ